MNPISLRLRFNPDAWRYPLCTRFFPLTPAGLDTGLHESLPSYLDRLARLHGVRNYPFLFYEVHPKPVLSSTSLVCENSSAMSLGNGSGERIAAFIARSTGVRDVALLVQPTLSNYLSWEKNLRPKAAWCPNCFAEWARKGMPIYRPLLWSFDCVRRCPVHNVNLQECCPRCTHQLDHFGGVSWTLFCPRCGHSLSEKENIMRDEKGFSPYDTFSTFGLVNLLRWGTTREPGKVEGGRFAINIRNAAEVCGGIHALSRRTRVTDKTVRSWRHGHSKPQLPALLRLSYCFDVPLPDWICQLIPATTFARVDRIPKGPSILQTYKRHAPRNVIEQALHDSLAKATIDPSSVVNLAKALGASRRSIYRNFPSLARQVAARRRHAVSTKKGISKGVVLEIIHQLRTDGKRVSQRAVLAVLKQRGIRGWSLYITVRRVCQEFLSDSLKVPPLVFS